MPHSLIGIFAYSASKNKIGLNKSLGPTNCLSGFMFKVPNSIVFQIGNMEEWASSSGRLRNVNIINLVPFERGKIRHVSPSSFEFFPKPLEKSSIIKPDTNHHYHKYHTRAKIIHGYSSFLKLIYDPPLSIGPARR